MSDGLINKNGAATKSAPQILGGGICAHKTNRGEKSKDGGILPRQS